MYYWPLAEMIAKAWERYIDFMIYILCWHPLNVKLHHEVYKGMPMFDKRGWSIPYCFKTIDGHGGNIYAKIDVLLAMVRIVVLNAAVIYLVILKAANA